MKALIYTGPEKVIYTDASDPEPRPEEALVRVDSLGICGSDMHAFLGHDERRPAPLILGHEAAGVVVQGPMEGKRVTFNPLATCGKCKACLRGQDNICPSRQIISMQPRQGAFAELVAIPGVNLVEVPDQIDLDQAALTEPIACGWHAAKLSQRSISIDLESANALVIGGGAIGVSSALSLKALGISDVVICEPNEIRRNYLTEKCGLQLIHPDELDVNSYFDVVIDGAGFESSRELASAKVQPGGAIVHIGLGSAKGGLDIRRITLQEITFIGSYTYTHQDFREAAQAMFDGRLGSLNWAIQRPLWEGQQAFEEIRSGSIAAPKTILKPN